MLELVQIQRVRRHDLYEAVRKHSAARKASLSEPQLPLHLLSLKLSDSVVQPPGTAIPDCISCGVCCSFAVIVPVSFDDSERVQDYCDVLLDVPESDIVVDRVLPRAAGGRCVNLMGELGTNIGCSIYPDRPWVCHNFESGSDRCHEYRRMYGLEPQLIATEVAAATERLLAKERPVVIEDVAIVSAGKVERTSFSVADGRAEHYAAELLSIVVFLDNEEPVELHTFEYGAERWLESDFLGLTFAEAKNRIKEQAR
jgi:Fe-S-cluster containining protein